MLPILVSRQLLEGLQEFLRATFPITTPGFLREGGQSFVDGLAAHRGCPGQGTAVGSEAAIPTLGRRRITFFPYRIELRPVEARVLGEIPIVGHKIPVAAQSCGSLVRW
ncbi:MAG: hypothetical protein ACREX4_20455 [Gammaproteobacteria bacterium]